MLRRSVGCKEYSPCPSAFRPTRHPDSQFLSHHLVVALGYRTGFTAEGVEDGPWDVRAFKELFRHVQRLLDVPGDEVHIAATVESGSPAGESEHFEPSPPVTLPPVCRKSNF